MFYLDVAHIEPSAVKNKGEFITECLEECIYRLVKQDSTVKKPPALLWMRRQFGSFACQALKASDAK